MSTKKNKINWFYAILGSVFVSFSFWSEAEDFSKSELETVTVVANSGINKVRGSYEYRLWTNTYKCAFVFTTAACIAAHWENIENITKHDTLQLKIHRSRLADLNTNSEDVPVYSLVKNNAVIFDEEVYFMSHNRLNKRLNILLLFFGLLLFLRGLVLISHKTTFILALVGLATALTLHVTGIWK